MRSLQSFLKEIPFTEHYFFLHKMRNHAGLLDFVHIIQVN